MNTKSFIFIIAVILNVIAVGCADKNDDLREQLIEDTGIAGNDKDKKLLHKPTGAENIKIMNQSVLIDFSLDEIMLDAMSHKNSYYDNDNRIIEKSLFSAFSTFGQLLDYYMRCNCYYELSYSSRSRIDDGEVFYPPVEYALAQECFRDECSTETRKAVLQIVLDKHERKTNELYLSSYNTRRTGMFLIAVILVKENDKAFMNVVLENRNVQNTLRMNLDEESRIDILRTGNSADSVICQLAKDFLSKK